MGLHHISNTYYICISHFVHIVVEFEKFVFMRLVLLFIANGKITFGPSIARLFLFLSWESNECIKFGRVFTPTLFHGSLNLHVSLAPFFFLFALHSSLHSKRSR